MLKIKSDLREIISDDIEILIPVVIGFVSGVIIGYFIFL